MPYSVVVEYCCLVDASESLHVLRPQLAGANDNQYVIIFQGERDWSLLALTGDWEYAAVSHCLSLATNMLVGRDAPRTGSYAVGSLARGRNSDAGHMVGAEVSVAKVAPASGDMFGRLTIRLGEDAQPPYLRARRWSGIDDRTFRIYRTDAELAKIGRLLLRIEEAQFEPVFESDHNAWFMPDVFRRGSAFALESLVMSKNLHICKQHVRDVCPSGFSEFWLALFCELDLPELARCPSCKGFFSRPTGQTWRKICFGCYRGEAPSAFQKSEIDSVAVIAPWLRRIWYETPDASSCSDHHP